MLDIVVAIVSSLLIAVVLWDAFEVIVLPRRVNRDLRIASLFYQTTWFPWSLIGRRLQGNTRETFLGAYAPLSLIVLLGLWAVLLVVGFAGLHWSIGTVVDEPGNSADFGTDLYLSASSFFTLGLGDVKPDSSISRFVTVLEGGPGFGFLALVISYLPVLYQAFSRREVNVSLLDSRAGSPPSAGEFLLRLGRRGTAEKLRDHLEDWERWSAELLESHLSYPILTVYRSQHEHQSWLAALTMVLDVCALIMCGFVEYEAPQAKLTFAITRHAAVDIAQIFGADPHDRYVDRLPPEDFARLTELVGQNADPAAEGRLSELRLMYEPFVAAISDYLLMPLPSWLPNDRDDDWQSTAWSN